MSDELNDPVTDNPFHVAHWPRSIIFPEDYDDGERLSLDWDLGRVSDKEKKAAIKAWCKKLPEMSGLTGLSLWSHVNRPLFEAACRARNLQAFQIKKSSIKKLDAIVELSDLRYLYIGSSTQVGSLEPLAALENLRYLELENFKLISDFSPLLALKALEVLCVTGSMWTRQKVASLEPFAEMTWLRMLCVDVSSVGSLRPLAKLIDLEVLGIGGQLPMEEYAWLAAKLPHTDCKWFRPYLDLAGVGFTHCSKCRRDSKVMLTGKRQPVLCRFCDEGRVRRHEAAFAAVHEEALAGGL